MRSFNHNNINLSLKFTIENVERQVQTNRGNFIFITILLFSKYLVVSFIWSEVLVLPKNFKSAPKYVENVFGSFQYDFRIVCDRQLDNQGVII